MSIEAMKQALEALEMLAKWEHPASNITTKTGRIYPHRVAVDAADSLRTAIEQAEKQEPVAWMKEGGFRSQVTFDWRIAKREGLTIPLYSRPQLACAPTHEPVATMTVRHTKNKTEIGYGPASKGYDLPNGEYKLYTTPPAAQRQWVGLTDEQINELRQQYGVTSNGRGIKEFTYVCDFVRAIEAKLRENGGQV